MRDGSCAVRAQRGRGQGCLTPDDSSPDSARARATLRRGARLCPVGGTRFVRLAPPAPSHALAQPGGEVALAELAFGERHVKRIQLQVARLERRAVQFQECLAGDCRGALVAVEEWMVASEPVCQRRSEIDVGVQLLRARQRRLQQPLVADAARAAVLRELSLVDERRQCFADPDHSYFASLLSSVRRLRMTRSATSIWSASSGSKGVSLTPSGSSVA